MNKYKNAEQLIPIHTKELVLNGDINVYWIDDNHFWYLMDKKHDDKVIKKFVVVSCEAGEKTILFNYSQFIQTFNGLANTNYTVYDFPAHYMTFNITSVA